MNRSIRLRKYNPKDKEYDQMFPQGITTNILRHDNGGVLENDLNKYDRHTGSDILHFNRAESKGTFRDLTVDCPGVILTDGFPLLLTLHTNLEAGPTISFNKSKPAYIVTGNGEQIPGGQVGGTVIFVIWNAVSSQWILMSSDSYSDVTQVVFPVESEHNYTAVEDGEYLFTIPGFDKDTDRLIINFGQTILRYKLDYTFVPYSKNIVSLNTLRLRRGNILAFTITTFVTTTRRGRLKYDLISTEYPVNITADDTSVIRLPKEAADAHSIMVNYNQTILRNNLDYTYSVDKTTITLSTIRLKAGEVITFNIAKFVESTAPILPNNWGTTGNYRYTVKVLHVSYMAKQDGETVVTVPGFNYKNDDVTVIRDNKLYVKDVDYVVDEVGQVVLIKGLTLKKGDMLHFTILQGAMIDVPNFNVIKADGADGKNITLNMSYTELVNDYVLLVRLKYDLEDSPNIKCLDGPAEGVYDASGNPVKAGLPAGSYLWMVYSRDRRIWYSLNPTNASKYSIDDVMGEVRRLEADTTYTKSGSGFFLGQASRPVGADLVELVIPHSLPSTLVIENVLVTPIAPPTKTGEVLESIGDVWTHWDTSNIYIGNTGNSRSKFTYTIMYHFERNVTR